MGACSTKLIINKDLYFTMKANPSDPKMLLVFQLHYGMYDVESQKQIDELTQLYLGTDHTLHLEMPVLPLSGPVVEVMS
jgi:hypothetical protein